MLQTTEKRIKISGYPVQMEFITDKGFASAFVAGKGAGKTHGGSEKSLDFCLKNPGASGIVTAPEHRVLEFATIPCYQKVFPAEFIIKEKYRPHPEWTLQGGGKIYFWSTNKPETIAGGEIAFSHMDEGSLSPYLAWLNIRSRLRQRKPDGSDYPYQVWVTTTPKQLNWLYAEFAREIREGYRLFQASTRDNIYMTDVEAYIERMGVSGKQADQDIEGKFLVLAGDCLFDLAVLEARMADCTPPLECRENGIIQIWKPRVVGVNYIAGADCADEGGEGVNDMIIMDSQTGEEMAEIHGDISADWFAQLCFELGSEYNFPLLAPERNATAGGLVVAKLEALGYKNLYKDDKGKYGWCTTTSAIPPKVSRYTMLAEYEEAVRTRGTVIRNSDAIGEMSTFVRNIGDKFEHLAGYKDDTVMARAICWQMRKQRLHKSSTEFKSWIRQEGTY